jgi:uncharacterized protein
MLGTAGRPDMSLRLWLGALLAALALLLPGAALAQQFPALTGRVVDAANILPPDVEARLTQKLAALDTQSHRQLVVATIPSLDGYDIADYGYRLGRTWQIGGKDKNDGTILIIAPTDRKVRVEVGYGVEGIITDGLSSLIIQNSVIPRFKAGDMPGGIEAGTDALIAQLTLPEDQARQLAAQAQAQAIARPPAQSGGIDFSTIVFLIFFFLFFVLPLIRAMRGGKRYRGRGPVVIWPGSTGSGWGGGGGGWSSGGSDFGGGGGFSGGGGSFGGGGASGSW